MLFTTEFFRANRCDDKVASELEVYNSQHLLIHPAFVSRIMTIDTSDYFGARERKAVARGWRSVLVKGLYHKDDPFLLPLYVSEKDFYKMGISII